MFVINVVLIIVKLSILMNVEYFLLLNFNEYVDILNIIIIFYYMLFIMVKNY